MIGTYRVSGGTPWTCVPVPVPVQVSSVSASSIGFILAWFGALTAHSRPKAGKPEFHYLGNKVPGGLFP